MESLFFDPSEKIDFRHGGALPQWVQEGKLIYATFRLADSLAQTQIKELKSVRESFLRLNPMPWNRDTELRYRNLITKRKEALLDAGYGSCVLKYPEIRKIVEAAFAYNERQRCFLPAYVIMPNHVHCILIANEGNDVSSILKSIKSYSARLINKALGTKGTLWLDENFTRLVRSEAHYKYYLSYIRHNPDFLPLDHYTLYLNY